MIYQSLKASTLLFLLASLNLKILALEIGCNTVTNKEESCTEDNTLLEEKSFKLTNLTNTPPNKAVSPQKTNITPTLDSIKIHYQNKVFLIERKIDSNKSCPPYCIQPMYIDKVKTVAEIETLNFIQALQKHKSMLLIDSRSTKAYNTNTIPGAINIPSSLLHPNSKYSKRILTLLGGKKLQKKWYFKTPHKLLIFDNGLEDTHASDIIKQLIKIGYPQKEILYYRGGIQDWKEAGLTLF